MWREWEWLSRDLWESCNLRVFDRCLATEMRPERAELLEFHHTVAVRIKLPE